MALDRKGCILWANRVITRMLKYVKAGSLPAAYTGIEDWLYDLWPGELPWKWPDIREVVACMLEHRRFGDIQVFFMQKYHFNLMEELQRGIREWEKLAGDDGEDEPWRNPPVFDKEWLVIDRNTKRPIGRADSLADALRGMREAREAGIDADVIRAAWWIKGKIKDNPRIKFSERKPRGRGHRRKRSKQASEFISSKISKLAHEGYESPQRIRIAYEMARKRGFKVPAANPRKRDQERLKSIAIKLDNGKIVVGGPKDITHLDIALRVRGDRAYRGGFEGGWVTTSGRFVDAWEAEGLLVKYDKEARRELEHGGYLHSTGIHPPYGPGSGGKRRFKNPPRDYFAVIDYGKVIGNRFRFAVQYLPEPRPLQVPPGVQILVRGMTKEGARALADHLNSEIKRGHHVPRHPVVRLNPAFLRGRRGGAFFQVRRSNPTLAVMGANPPRAAGDDIEATWAFLSYRRPDDPDGKRIVREHEFTDGVVATPLDDGSIILRHPRGHNLWTRR